MIISPFGKGWSFICKKQKQKKTRGPWATSLTWETVQINKHIWLYHDVDYEEKKITLLTLWEFIGSSFEQTWIPFTQGGFVSSLVEIG